MRVVLAGGGTAGHVYPALSVAACLAGHDVLYCGSPSGPEAEIVPAAGLTFRGLTAGRLSRAASPAALIAGVGATTRGVGEAMRVLREWRPDAVLVTGGFASTGAGMAAVLLGVPLVVNDANSIPGRSNRLLGRFARFVAVSFPGSERYFPRKRVRLTGMPVRESVRRVDPDSARARLGIRQTGGLLVVVGGSQGSRAINGAVLDALPALLAVGATVAHQTGARNLEQVVAEAGGEGRLPYRYHPFAYDPDLPSLMNAASLILCRGGSSTLAEVCVLGKPSLIVPLPSAVHDHQRHNALALASRGAAEVLSESSLSGPGLAEAAGGLLCDGERLASMAAAARELARPDAARAVADLLLECARTRPGRSTGPCGANDPTED